MALDNYADLQTSIANWLMRPSDTTITSVIPDLILLFEEEARDRLKTRFSEQTTTLTTIGGQATLPVPSMFESARELVLQGSPNQILTYVTPEEMDATWVGDATGDMDDSPEVFTIIGTNFKFAPTPATGQTITCDYMQGIPALSSGSPTNWLLQNYPSLYLVGSLLWAEAFIADDERVQTWAALREAAFNRILSADIKARWSGETLQIKTDTGNP